MTKTAKVKVWLDYDQDELNDQYNQRVLVPDADTYSQQNLANSARVREILAPSQLLGNQPSRGRRPRKPLQRHATPF